MRYVGDWTRRGLAALGCLVAAWSVNAAGFETAKLPDGSVFDTWEKPLAFKRTFHVAQNTRHASDANKGSERRPWKTIGRAAQELQPGDRVVIHAGVYREWVKPVRGGAGPDAMISYEAAPGEEVVLKGSDVWTPAWRKTQYMTLGSVTTWEADLTSRMFEGANVFALLNFPSQTNQKDWKFYPSFEWRRGQIFVDGSPLEQVGEFGALAAAPGRFWVEDNGMRVHVRLPNDADPSGRMIEITTREQVFAPVTPYLNYIRIKGLKMFHSGNGVPIPPPQRGLISAMRGHHWIIEDCEIGHANTLGVDLGGQWWSLGVGEAQGYHVVRRNYIHDCGVSSISAWHNMGNVHMLVEDNLIVRCATMPIMQHYESAGIKIHRTEHSLVRRNAVLDTPHGPGIWLDGEILNSRITQNLVVNTGGDHLGAIFVEITKEINLVDNNIVINSASNGVYQHDAERLMVMQNLIVHGSGSAIHFNPGNPMRLNPPFQNHHRAYGNVLTGYPVAVFRPNATTCSDFNVIDVAKGSLPFREGEFDVKPEEMDLAAWQAKGQDTHSKTAEIAVAFDRENLLLTMTSSVALPATFPDLPEILPGAALAKDVLTADFFGRARRSGLFEAGPFSQAPPVGVAFSVDPRRKE